MHEYIFDWDEGKNKVNINKHGITFNEAMSVFDDINALYESDMEHSENEERFIVIGFSTLSNLLMVCHCYRNGDGIIRIISARRANMAESEQYWRNRI